MNSPRRETLQRLTSQIEAIEVAHHPSRPTLTFGIPALDALAPYGLPAGSLVDLIASCEGAGHWTLGFILARQACQDKHLVLIHADGFYPGALVRLAIPLERTIVVHPNSLRDAHIAVEYCLRCPAIGAVVAPCGQMNSRQFRRLQLASEAGGGLGILLRPLAVRRSPSFAAMRLLLAPVPCKEAYRKIQVEVLHYQKGRPGQSLLLEIDDEGHVYSSADLASAKNETRPSRASG